LPVVVEAFADRAYRADGSLLPRGSAGAVLTDPELVANRVLRLLTEGCLPAEDGSLLRLAPDSVCVHGDTPGAGVILQAIRDRLHTAGIEIVRFA
jgi:UPF0271 protein